MREIKFRAWDKNNKGFINGFNMYGFSTGQGAPSRKLKRFYSEWNEEDIELMQYTGIKDNNGKEIYEGDIVKTKSGIGVVEWAEDSLLWIVRLSERCTDWLITYDDDIEVVGNIYKNPELLQCEDNV